MAIFKVKTFEVYKQAKDIVMSLKIMQIAQNNLIKPEIDRIQLQYLAKRTQQWHNVRIYIKNEKKRELVQVGKQNHHDDST